MGDKKKIQRALREHEQAARPTFAIANIHPGEVSAGFCYSLASVLLLDAATGPRCRGLLQEWSSANVSQSRNRLVESFLDGTTAEWLVFVDSDMIFDADAVHRLVDTAAVDDLPILGGLCFGGNHDRLFPTIYVGVELEGGGQALTTVNEYPRDCVVQCHATGGAFLAIRRDVLEHMRREWGGRAFPWFQETEYGGRPVGEDITFCLRAQQLGYLVHVDTRIRVGHHKSLVYTEALFTRQAPDADRRIGLTIPTRGDHLDLLRATIATSGLPPERVVVVWTGQDEPPELAATVLVDRDPVNIHRWWNTGIDALAEKGVTRVAVLNDDVSIAPDTLARLSAALDDGSTLAMPSDGTTVTGWCWMLNAGHGVRADEAYHWYCGDLQLVADALGAGGMAIAPDAWVHHHHPNEATAASPELLELALADNALYDARHPAGMPHARTHVKEVASVHR